MRPLLLLVLLGVVGLAAWLLYDKLTLKAPSPSSSPSSSEVSNTGSAPIEITDTSPPQAKPSSTPSKSSERKPSAYVSLDHARAAFRGKCEYVRHTYYALCYDEEHEQARWTVYILEGKKLREGRIRRTQDFRPDPKVSTRSAQLADYRRSGYDRGHLVPAGDFKWDSIGMSETFYLSNISPQIHEFNAGIWEEVESTVRAWARQKGRLVVYTGPLLDTIKERIGSSRVSVPRGYYKVVYHLDEKVSSAIGFLVPHAPSSKSPLSYIVTVDSVEKVTGIDFFPALPDGVEERIESRLELRLWEAPRKR